MSKEDANALEMTPEMVANFAKTFNLDEKIVQGVLQKERILNESDEVHAVFGHFVALCLFRGDKEMLEAIKGNYMNVAIVAMLALTITIPLFVNRGTFTTDPYLLDIFQVLMGLSSIFSIAAVVMPLAFCGFLSQLCPARSDVTHFLSLGTATDPELFVNFGVALGFAGFCLAAAQGFDNPKNGYVLVAIGGFSLLVIFYRWMRTNMAVTYSVREKYFVLNSGNVKKDWQVYAMDFFFGLAGMKTGIQSENYVQPPPVTPPFGTSTMPGRDDRLFASTQHDTAY